jgi:hypothetical protein
LHLALICVNNYWDILEIIDFSHLKDICYAILMAIKWKKHIKKMKLNAKTNVIFWQYSHKIADSCLYKYYMLYEDTYLFLLSYMLYDIQEKHDDSRYHTLGNGKTKFCISFFHIDVKFGIQSPNQGDFWHTFEFLKSK